MTKQMRQAGSSMIEVLVTLVILLIGLLGLAGLQVQSHSTELESYQRVQAIILQQDMVDRLSINPDVASCYAFTTDTAAGAPFLGTNGNASTLTCTAGTEAQQIAALADLAAWDAALKGSAESGNAGAMIGGRGCIVEEDATNRIYRISVAWQGKLKTVDPTTVAKYETDATGTLVNVASNLTCGKNLYGDERMRRILSTTVRIGILN